MPETFVVPFGPDGTTGDSAFYAGAKGNYFKVDGGEDSFDELYKIWLESDLTKDAKADMLIDGKTDITEYHDVIGFWIIDETTVLAASAPWESDPGNDGACYACNAAAKQICKLLGRTVMSKWKIDDDLVASVFSDLPDRFRVVDAALLEQYFDVDYSNAESETNGKISGPFTYAKQAIDIMEQQGLIASIGNRIWRKV